MTYQSGDEVFVLSTTRGVGAASQMIVGGGSDVMSGAVLVSLRHARPDLDWDVRKRRFYLWSTRCVAVA
jgi:hypothetical protein